MTDTETETVTVNQATVRAHAGHLGLHLVSTMRVEELDKWWLSSSTNWVTTEPGKPLAEIAAVLDEMDGGEWTRQQAEAAERRALEAAEQEAVRLRLAAAAETDDDEDDQAEDKAL